VSDDQPRVDPLGADRGAAVTPGPSRLLTISGIYQRDELLGDAVARPGALRGLGLEPAVTKLVLVRTAGNPGVVAGRLARVTAGIPNSAAQSADDYVTSQTDSLDVVLGIVDVLLLFAVLVAALGIANTLALAVVERTRELGLLRAAGMERRVVRRMIRIEGVLIALFGGVLGIGFGVAFGATVADSLPVNTARLTIPTGRLALLVVAAGLLGIIAAAVPARRAARLDVLAAVAEP
jgi:putative ABC transport system permease protein